MKLQGHRRAIVKVRQVGDCLVVGLSQVILEKFQVKKGDRIMVTVSKGGNMLLISKEL